MTRKARRPAAKTPPSQPPANKGTIISGCNFTIDNKTNEHDAAVIVALANAAESNASALQAIAEAYRYHGPANVAGLHISSPPDKAKADGPRWEPQ